MSYRKSEIERIADVAGKAAMSRGRKVCSIDKANVLETSVLWRKTVSEFFAKNYPEVALSHMYVDNAAMQLARDPNQFDVFFTENMFGDILSDEMAVICGSLGMLCSASLGVAKNSAGEKFGLYEPAGGTAPDIAGKKNRQPLRADTFRRPHAPLLLREGGDRRKDRKGGKGRRMLWRPHGRHRLRQKRRLDGRNGSRCEGKALTRPRRRGDSPRRPPPKTPRAPAPKIFAK